MHGIDAGTGWSRFSALEPAGKNVVSYIYGRVHTRDGNHIAKES
jgi:hypothetical protein